MLEDLGVDLLAGALEIRVGAVEELNAERGGADIERLQLDHAHGLEDFVIGEGHAEPQIRCM